MRTTHALRRLALTAALSASLVVAPAAVSVAAPSLHVFRYCADVRTMYSGGIAKHGVSYNTTHWRGQTHHRALKGSVKFSTALYNVNQGLDADHDGIACEKS